MDILYFTHYYAPERIAPAFRAHDNAHLWSKAGHHVTIYTGYPNHPNGIIFDGYIPRLLSEENDEGVRVLRNKLIAKQPTSFVNRFENAISFFAYGLVNIIWNAKIIGRDYDIILGTSSVIFTALLGWLYAKKIKKNYVFELRDITYQQMIATGEKENAFSVQIMRALELFMCRHAKKVVVVTNGFKKILISEGIPETKIHVITNGVDISEQYRKRADADSLVLSYFGTIGISQSIEQTFQYADLLQTLIPKFKYILIGGGAEREKIFEMVDNGVCKSAEMRDDMPPEKLEKFYQMTDLSVVSLKRNPAFQFTIPSKLFQIMGRGIAVLAIVPKGEASEIIEKYKAGLALTGSDEENKQKLKEFFSRKDWHQKLREMGTNGRKAVQEYYCRKKLAMDYIDLLQNCVDN